MNPCGRVVDHRQHFRAYRTRMHFFRDDPSLVTVVRWFTVPKNRPFLELFSPFMSRRWERDLSQPPLGEELPAFELCRDYEPPGLTGERICGRPDQWLNGALTTDPTPQVDPSSGVPFCCGRPVQVGSGGEAEGSPVESPAGGCANPIPALLSAHFTAPIGPTPVGDVIVHLALDGGIWHVVDSVPNVGGDLKYWTLQPIGLNWLFDDPAARAGGATFVLSCIPFALFTFDVIWLDFPFFYHGDVAIVEGWLPFSRGTGGEAEGGRGWILLGTVQYGYGGEAEGGGPPPPPPPQVGSGGEAEGGSGAVGAAGLARGGEAEGGSGTAAQNRAAGGEAEGGSGTP